MRSFVAARALMGAALLLADRPVLAAIGGAAPDRRERAFAFALAARQLVQATATWRHPTVAALRTGAAVDALHGASTAWLLTHSRYRRPAMANLVCAGGFALTGLIVSGRAGPTSDQSTA